MPVRNDPSLEPAPGGDRPPGRLGVAEPPVVRAGPASSAPFLLEGERVAVVGDERRGEQAVWVDGEAALTNLATDAGGAVNVVAAPSSLRRELLGARGTLLEHTLAAPVLPLAAVQWAAPPGGTDLRGVEVAFSVLPARRDVRYRVLEGGVVAVGEGATSLRVEVRLHPTPAEWVVVEGPGGGLGVRAVVEGPGPVTLLVAAGDAGTVGRALAAAPHLGAQEISAAAEADPANLPLLHTRTGVAELDHGVVWATARLRAALHRPGALTGEAAFWAGVGAMAVGDGAGARRAVQALASAEGEGASLLGGALPLRALATLLAARHALLTDETGPARSALDGLDPPTLEAARRSESGWPVWALALATLADALRHAATADELATLRAAATTPVKGGAMRLPMVGAPRAHDAAGLLGDLLGGGGGAGTPHLPGSPLEGWALWAASRPDEAWAAWRGRVGAGLAGQPHGRGCWDPVDGPPGAASGAALLLCGMAWGLLGLVPDAPSGRIRVAPALPGHLRSFEAREIRVGEFRFTLRLERDGGDHRLTLEPTHGRVPPVVVLEPSFPCAAVAGIRVDGAPAELDISSAPGGRTRVRLQLPLDGLRTVEVAEGASADPDT